MFEFDAIIKRINSYLLEDRMLQKESNKIRDDGGEEELSRQYFARHLKLRADVKQMSDEVKTFIRQFLEKWEEI